MTDEPRSPNHGADHSPDTTQLPPPATDPSVHAYSRVPPDGADDFVPYQAPRQGSTSTFDSPSQAFPAPSQQFESPGVVPKAPGRRHLGKIIGLVSVVVVLLLVIGLVSFELYSRHKVKDCIAQGVTSVTGSQVDVSLSAKPLLLQALSGDIPFIQVDTKDAANASSKLHLRLDDLTGDSTGSKVGSIRGNGSLSFDRILELSKGQSTSTTTSGDSGTSSSNGAISKIAGNSADGTITIDSSFVVAIFPIPVSVTVKPQVVDGKITFPVTSATAAVFGIPSQYAQGIVDQMSKSMFSAMFDVVKFSSIKVTDTGVDFVVAGDNVALKQNVSNPSGSCSSLF
ncbi:DUF2993 domain-containing protein [Gordonia sp. TBRC 11910]|uniref:DUF2993 domain-containing protein n=1 Tax=Gordonia asplenii TaxID=2725283 RepID=A0A848KQ20_9ACTN|nr:LmeA family phospholipid-binding protein [Gordonia asplenii]NMO00776.1 DUF2993 domain-containing protein [Gordonia asplenii]